MPKEGEEQEREGGGKTREDKGREKCCCIFAKIYMGTFTSHIAHNLNTFILCSKATKHYEIPDGSHM